MRLHEWQQALSAALANPGAPLPPLRAHGVPGARRVAVHRNNRWAAQHAALAAIYPVTQRLLGAACFQALAHHYLTEFPSRQADLRRLGRHLPGLCARRAEFAALPYLRDVARLEWAWHRAFHAVDAPALTPAHLAGMQADTVRLHPHPACAVIVSRHPVLDIWQANQDAGDGRADLRTGAQCVLVTRPDMQVELRVLSRADTAFVAAASRGAALAQAIARALRAGGPFDPVAALPALITAGAWQAPSA